MFGELKDMWKGTVVAIFKKSSRYGSPTRGVQAECGPPRSTVLLAAAFVNWVYIIKITK